jgi:hypothetical protein
MNFSSISGILLSLAAVIWVALIIPAWFQSSENRTQIRQAKLEAKSKAAALKTSGLRASNCAQVFAKVNRLRLVGFAFLISAGALIWFDISNPVSVTAGSALAIVSFAVLRRSLVVKRQLLAQSIRNRKIKVPQRIINLDFSENPAEISETNSGWKPNEVPKPMHQLNMNGTLEAAVLAEVKPLQPKATEEISNASIDEILKRRRAI